MRHAALITSVFAVALIGLAVLSRTGLSSAQDATPPTDGQVLVGSWWLTVSEEQGTPFLALGTFAADGTVVVSPPPVVPPSPRGPGTVVHTSAGHGAWAGTGPDMAILTFALQASDGDGNPMAIRTIRTNITLGADGQTFSGEFVATIANPAGTPVATESGTIQAQRIVAEAPEMPTTATPTT